MQNSLNFDGKNSLNIRISDLLQVATTIYPTFVFPECCKDSDFATLLLALFKSSLPRVTFRKSHLLKRICLFGGVSETSNVAFYNGLSC